MYKFYMKNGTAYFYEHGIEIDGTVYGILCDSDVLRIKRRIVNSKFTDLDNEFDSSDNEFNGSDNKFDMNAEIGKISHTDITFEQPTAEQLERIQAKTFDNMPELKQHVQAVMNGETMSQDEINAMLMLQIAELKAGVSDE